MCRNRIGDKRGWWGAVLAGMKLRIFENWATLSGIAEEGLTPLGLKDVDFQFANDFEDGEEGAVGIDASEGAVGDFDMAGTDGTLADGPVESVPVAADEDFGPHMVAETGGLFDVDQPHGDASGYAGGSAQGGQQDSVFGAVAATGIDDFVGAGKADGEVLVGHVLIDPGFEEVGSFPGIFEAFGGLFDDGADLRVVGLDVGIAGQELLAWTGGGLVFWSGALDEEVDGDAVGGGRFGEDFLVGRFGDGVSGGLVGKV